MSIGLKSFRGSRGILMPGITTSMRGSIHTTTNTMMACTMQIMCWGRWMDTGSLLATAGAVLRRGHHPPKPRTILRKMATGLTPNPTGILQKEKAPTQRTVSPRQAPTMMKPMKTTIGCRFRRMHTVSGRERDSACERENSVCNTERMATGMRSSCSASAGAFIHVGLQSGFIQAVVKCW